MKKELKEEQTQIETQKLFKKLDKRAGSEISLDLLEELGIVRQTKNERIVPILWSRSLSHQLESAWREKKYGSSQSTEY